MGSKVLLMINPMSGRQRIKSELVYVIDELTRAGYETVVFTTQGHEKTREILQKAEGRFDLIICSGGDGTFNELLSNVLKWENKPRLGYIPAGSTNDFAAGLNLSVDIQTAANDIIIGEPHTFDAGHFNEDYYFSYVASFGAFTEASYSTPQNIKNNFGHFAYIMEGMRELPNAVTEYHMIIESNGEIIDDEFCFGAISNAKSVGGVFKMSDDFVDLNDGLFEVMLIRRPKTPVDISLIISSLNSMNYDNRMFVTFQTSRVKLSTDEPLTWTLDGEKVDGGTQADITCIRDAYQLMVNPERSKKQAGPAFNWI